MVKSMTLDATIPAKPAQIFAVLASLDQAREWMPSIQKITPVSDGPFGKGSIWTEKRKDAKGREMEATISVTDFQPTKSLGLRVEGRMFWMNLRFDLAPAGDQTVVHYDSEFSGKGLFRLMNGMILKQMQQTDADLLDRLAAQTAKPVLKAK